MPLTRRLRGHVLRLVLNRRLAISLGAAIAAPGVWLFVMDYSWECGISDGLSLVSLATGVALAWAGVSGRQPDWQ